MLDDYTFQQYYLPIINDGSTYKRLRSALGSTTGIRFGLVETLCNKLYDNFDLKKPTRDQIYALVDELTRYFRNEVAQSDAPRPISSKPFVPEDVISRNQGSCTVSIVQPQPQPQEPQAVANTPRFETRHYVNGVEAKNMNDEDLIYAIKDVEDDIEKLKTVKTQSKAIDKKIASLTEQLTSIVNILDSRA